jgi:DNA-binding MarR family transcriptional regulator
MGAGARDVRVAVDAFRRIVQALRVSSRETEHRTGISAAQLFALHQLAGSAGASVNQLAALTFTDQSSVSVVVRRLENQGLVTRQTSPNDRRRVRLAVTARGRAVLRRAPEPVQERLIAAIGALPGRRRALLASSLRAIASAIGNGAEPPAMFFEDHRRRRRAPRVISASR